MRYFTLSLVLFVAISAGNSDAADDELFIPRISGIPSLSDFKSNDLRQDGDQIFIKFSYLFQR